MVGTPKLRKAVGGSGEASFRLGVHYDEQGQYESAIQSYLAAAAVGIRNAKYNLGVTYLKGMGDRERSIYWYAEAAEDGDGDAMMMVGAECFASGDLEGSIRWSKGAVEAGHDKAPEQLHAL